MFPFFTIVSFLAASYAFISKQFKLGLGFLIYAVVFVLLIPNLSSGIKSSFMEAGALILFLTGSFVIIWKRKEKPKTDEGEKPAE